MSGGGLPNGRRKERLAALLRGVGCHGKGLALGRPLDSAAQDQDTDRDSEQTACQYGGGDGLDHGGLGPFPKPKFSGPLSSITMPR